MTPSTSGGAAKLGYRVANGLLFYLNWFICLEGVISGRPFLGVISSVVILCIHFFIVKQRLQDFILVATLIFFGLLVDTTLMNNGVLQFASPNKFFVSLAPIWVLSLHAIFGTTINHSLAYLDRHWLMSAIFGAGGGGFSYFVGEKVGAVEFLLPTYESVAVIALVWMIYFPLIFRYRDWLEEKL